MCSPGKPFETDRLLRAKSCQANAESLALEAQAGVQWRRINLYVLDGVEYKNFSKSQELI